jgi:hypothetical protein
VMVHDLSPQAVKQMVRVDLANASEQPPSAIGTFDSTAARAGLQASRGDRPGNCIRRTNCSTFSPAKHN